MDYEVSSSSRSETLNRIIIAALSNDVICRERFWISVAT